MRTLKVHALGPSGSGKTVFMASLYQRLRLKRPDLSFFLRSDHDSSVHLNAVYNRLVSPEEPWPEASQGVHEWRFVTCVPTLQGDFEPLDFHYLDYPGGILTHPDAARDETIRGLVGELRSANALLVLLDGQAMRALLGGERSGRRYLEFDITSSLEIVQQSRCPVHFVVTKWDLLEGMFPLEAVRDRLMADQNFADLVAAKSEDTAATIRLLPVSAVGSGFADLLPNGEMRKRGGRVQPQHVELPLVSVMPDFLQMAATVPVASAPGWAGDAGFVERLLHFRGERARLGREKYAAQVLEDRRDVDGEAAALHLVERQFEQLLSDFEVAHPASVLARGLEQFTPPAPAGPTTPVSHEDRLSGAEAEPQGRAAGPLKFVSPPLLDGETVQAQWKATRPGGLLSTVGGTLYLTDVRLIFAPNWADRTMMGRRSWDARLEAVTEVRAAPMKEGPGIGGMAVRSAGKIAVAQGSDMAYFLVRKPDSVLAALTAAVARG